MQINVGLAGEYRCMVKNADGSIHTDTGYQSNLILNQGLDFFGSNGEYGTNIMNYCLIGAGTTVPSNIDMYIGSFIKSVKASAITDSKTSYDASEGTLYKTSVTRKYVFTDIDDATVAEVGLASKFNDYSDYYLCTRALIKDGTGKVAPITIPKGGSLVVYYKLWAVYDTADKSGTLNLLNSSGAATKYNYKVRLADVGSAKYLGDDIKTFILGAYLKGYSNQGNDIQLCSDDLSVMTGSPASALSSGVNFVASDYSELSYKRQITATFPLELGNGTFRTALIRTSLGHFQVRYGLYTADTAITKKNNQTLALPFEVSWAAYTGTL